MTRRLARLADFGLAGVPQPVKTWSQRVAEQVEAQLADLTSAVTAIAAAQATATAAQSTANTAVTDAATAQTTADTVTLNDKLTSSSILPASALSAADAGTDASITIADHARLYGDGSTIPVVTGGTITGLAFSTFYGVYYDDPTLSATTPTYHATTTPSNALNNFVVGRHFIGNVTTPADGGSGTTGGSSPPGTDPGDRDKYSTL